MIFVNLGDPLVKVPVLSKAIHFVFVRASNVCFVFIKIPCFPQVLTALRYAIGGPNIRLQGDATMRKDSER